MAFLDHGKTGDVFKDDQLLEGNLFKNLETIQNFFEKHLSFSRKFENSSWKRTDEYVFPMAALREGVMNALVHREYGLVSSALSIIIYPDKLEITNSGKSPFKQSELKKNHLSMPYNPDIAHIVFLRGYIEKIGRGTLKIIDACKQAGIKTPVWEIGEQTVKLTFFSDVKLGVATKGTNGGADAVNDAVKKGVIDAVSDTLTDAVRTIVANDKGTSITQIMERTGKSNAQVKRYLQTLKALDLIEFRGAPKTGKYYLTKKLKLKLK